MASGSWTSRLLHAIFYYIFVRTDCKNLILIQLIAVTTVVSKESLDGAGNYELFFSLKTKTD